jgi:hypothetical protein
MIALLNAIPQVYVDCSRGRVSDPGAKAAGRLVACAATCATGLALLG